ncbi:hypothetical protein KHA90_09135 [Flavobacterium psychroterrae]|uniref:Uncharacterized protein n=1 Tax=Flavobacterium psychroterrae TaxID=2133767 RepID=A0ABS5PA82_9FLAO|nr:hypothetical protein [Flavobacterium psychroterrae]MBS7231189.1 hypothetical protein [Flavobacterium psychroterrae]
MLIPNELYNVKFAEFIETIKKLYLVDDKFKNICDDYCNSKMNTEKYKRKFEKNFSNKLKSENLSKELEEEVLIYVMRKI